MRRAHETVRAVIRKLIERGRRESAIRPDLAVDWQVTASLALILAAPEEVRVRELDPNGALHALSVTIVDLIVGRDPARGEPPRQTNRSPSGTASDSCLTKGHAAYMWWPDEVLSTIYSWLGIGWGGRIRTFNLLIQSQLRYRCATPQASDLGRPPILASAWMRPSPPVFHMLSTPVVAWRPCVANRRRHRQATGASRVPCDGCRDGFQTALACSSGSAAEAACPSGDRSPPRAGAWPGRG